DRRRRVPTPPADRRFEPEPTALVALPSGRTPPRPRPGSRFLRVRGCRRIGLQRTGPLQRGPFGRLVAIESRNRSAIEPEIGIIGRVREIGLDDGSGARPVVVET